jgi:DNA polymerase-3 subunit beta
MKVICDREKFWQAFQAAQSVAPTRSPKPVLSNVKLEVTKEGATLLGTDLEISMRIEVAGVDMEAPGAALLPIARFGAILRENSDEKLVIESDGNKTEVRGQWSQFQLPSSNPAEFPAVPAFAEKKFHEVPARFFREVVRRTIFATDPESSRYALGGVLLEMLPETLIAVATDGRRLAKQEGPATSVGEHTTGDRMTIVPTRAMQAIDRALGDSDDVIRIAARDNDVVVKGGAATVCTRLVEGRFPKWRDVFPRRDDVVRIEMPIGPFYAAVRQAAIVTSEERRGVEFKFGDGKLVLAGHGAEFGESHVEMPIPFEGDADPVNLDPRFVSDFLRVLDAEKNCTIELRSSEMAVVISTDDNYSYIVMPLARDSN